MKKVYKYGTGDEVPEGVVYLCTKVQNEVAVPIPSELKREYQPDVTWEKCWLVWHYFLVEVEND